MQIDFEKFRSYTDGKISFMTGMFEKLNLPTIFNKHLERHVGRPPEIPYGVLAEMMLVNICDDHHPLSRLNEYYQDKDLESLFNHPITLSQINDDRFGGFLDVFHEAGPRKIFSEIAANAFITYGIKVQNINFDTTSKVMWGTYDADGETAGVISINYGYSKQKRQDKKQIKMSIGTANGVIVDAKVLSDNASDKTFNKEQLEDVNDILIDLNIDKDSFYYIADSAAFSLDWLEKAKEKQIKLITRIPDNTNVVKEMIEHAATHFETMQDFESPITGKKANTYKILEMDGDYKSIPLKYCICYSEQLKSKKEISIQKQVELEKVAIEQLSKSYEGRNYACLADSQLEIEKTISKKIRKYKYHDVTMSIQENVKRKPGRPSKNSNDEAITNCYTLEFKYEANKSQIEKQIMSQSIFVLCSNDLGISAETILREYKTQGTVEKKFQQLKSPQFVNSLFIDSPRRVEALTYLLLIAVMTLSVVEYVVRREMAKNNEMIIGPGKVKMTKPSLIAIYRIFYSVLTTTYHDSVNTQRDFTRPLKDNIKTVLRCLGIPEEHFIRGSTIVS